MASTPIAVDRAGKFEKVCGILDHHARRPARLIPILQAVQHEYQYLPEEVLTYVATSLNVPPARVFGVATFYALCARAQRQARHPHLRRNCLPCEAVDSCSERATREAGHERDTEDHARYALH